MRKIIIKNKLILGKFSLFLQFQYILKSIYNKISWNRKIYVENLRTWGPAPWPLDDDTYLIWHLYSASSENFSQYVIWKPNHACMYDSVNIYMHKKFIWYRIYEVSLKSENQKLFSFKWYEEFKLAVWFLWNFRERINIKHQ